MNGKTKIQASISILQNDECWKKSNESRKNRIISFAVFASMLLIFQSIICLKSFSLGNQVISNHRNLANKTGCIKMDFKLLQRNLSIFLQQQKEKSLV
jgi:hypothetical protein